MTGIKGTNTSVLKYKYLITHVCDYLGLTEDVNIYVHGALNCSIRFNLEWPCKVKPKVTHICKAHFA